MNGAQLVHFDLYDPLAPTSGGITIAVVTARQSDPSTHSQTGTSQWQARKLQNLRGLDNQSINGLIVLIGHKRHRRRAETSGRDSSVSLESSSSPSSLPFRFWPISRGKGQGTFAGFALPLDSSISDISLARRTLLESFASVSIEMSVRVA